MNVLFTQLLLYDIYRLNGGTAPIAKESKTMPEIQKLNVVPSPSIKTPTTVKVASKDENLAKLKSMTNDFFSQM
jgi:hypothetical protein